jgi:hypothetical protein
MNPFLYPALLVLFAFSGMSSLLMSSPMGGLVLLPLLGMTASMLAAIGLASLTGTGGRGAVAVTVLLVAYVMFVIRYENFRDEESAADE